MLEFYYDCMNRYCPRTDFMYCEMDTDSAYIAISGKSLDCIVKPHMQQQYLRGLYDICNQLDIEADAFHGNAVPNKLKGINEHRGFLS